jgi:hypothetical protein
VQPNLREMFDRAVSDDPGADPGRMAYDAMIEGGGIRRRRRRNMAAAGVAAAVVTVLGTVAGVNLLTGAPRSADQPVTVAEAMMPVAAPSCSAKPVDSDATDVVLYLVADVTDAQRAALAKALHGDARVGTVQFEDREQAFLRFRARWKKHPDLVAAVGAQRLPESFRLRLTDAAQYAAFRAEYSAIGGVEQVVGRKCPASAPVGGVQ